MQELPTFLSHASFPQKLLKNTIHQDKGLTSEGKAPGKLGKGKHLKEDTGGILRMTSGQQPTEQLLWIRAGQRLPKGLLQDQVLEGQVYLNELRGVFRQFWI